MKIPLLQSEAWQKLQSELGEKTIFEKKDDYQFLAIYRSTPVGNYLYVPYGPVAKDASSFKKALKSLRVAAKENNCIFIRIEPQNPNFIKSCPDKTKKSTDLNPKETWVLDLKNKDEELKAKLPSRLLRYYKSAEKNGLSIETSHRPEDIKYLIDLQKALAREKGINTFSENYLKTELAQPFATLYIVRYHDPNETEDREAKNQKEESTNSTDEIVAAGLVFDDETTRYNLQGAQSDQGRKLHATGVLTIQLIKDAEEKNLQFFDFWGTAPENAPKNHPWAGFTNFKKTFKGEQVDYAGTYDIVLKPLKYKLYQLTRKINRLLRRA